MTVTYVSVVVGTVYVDGKPINLYRHRTRLPEDHVLVQRYPQFFEKEFDKAVPESEQPVVSSIEQMTAVPGERRRVSRNKSPKE